MQTIYDLSVLHQKNSCQIVTVAVCCEAQILKKIYFFGCSSQFLAGS